jgi:carbon monoxide dehydrogenase subunit G
VKLSYQGQEHLAASADTAWAFITDPDRLGPCLPDVQEVRVADATHFEAVVRVAVGLVRGKFTFKLVLAPDEADRRLTITANGGGMGSVVDLVAHAAISSGDGAGSLLDWDGEAAMRGPVAAVGGRVLDRQAQKLVEQTFVNVRTALQGG